MSIARQAVKGVFWLAGFRFLTQLLSWAITILVVRTLNPEDYGLMAMAGMFTGYVAIFSELGLGSAIVQKQEITQEELSSTFWLSLVLGASFAVIGLSLAYPTAWIFNEARLIPLICISSIIFIIDAVAIVPANILNRAVRFKEIGLIQLSSVIVSTLSMLAMARAGFGVWTLVLGPIILRSLNSFLVLLVARWRPLLHFQFTQARPFLAFGVGVAGSTSMAYLLEAGGNFIIGKAFGPQTLGHYSLALQLAKVPNDKIISIMDQASFPVLSRYKDDLPSMQHFYLNITRYVSLIVGPLFCAGIFFGDEIIRTVLGEKWLPLVSLFKVLCLAQFIAAITQINIVVHTSQGRPYWNMYFHALNAVLMTSALFLASRYGFDAVTIPWLAVYSPVCIGYIVLTLKQIRLSIADYVVSIGRPLMAPLLVMLSVYALTRLVSIGQPFSKSTGAALIREICIAAILYTAYLLMFERDRLREVWLLRKS